MLINTRKEMLIIGTGEKNRVISPNTRSLVHQLGIRMEAMDTHNAASYYNLLAQERSGQTIAVAMLAVGTFD